MYANTSGLFWSLPVTDQISQSPVYIYKPLASRWSIGHLQFSSTVLCPGLVVQFGSISGLFAAVYFRLIFSSCYSAYHAFVYLEGSKRVPAWLLYHVWPIHFHFFLLIWVIIFSSWVFANRSSLLMVFGHLTPRMLHRQRFVKAWIFVEIFFVTLQVSAPYTKTDFTFVLKILSLVLRDITLDFHTGLSRRNAVLALPILTGTSRSVPPSTAIRLPR